MAFLSLLSSLLWIKELLKQQQKQTEVSSAASGCGSQPSPFLCSRKSGYHFLARKALDVIKRISSFVKPSFCTSQPKRPLRMLLSGPLLVIWDGADLFHVHSIIKLSLLYGDLKLVV